MTHGKLIIYQKWARSAFRLKIGRGTAPVCLSKRRMNLMVQSESFIEPAPRNAEKFPLLSEGYSWPSKIGADMNFWNF